MSIMLTPADSVLSCLMNVTCSFDDCVDVVDRKGYCMKHYMRQYRNGTMALNGPRMKYCKRCGTSFKPATNRVVYCTERCKRGEADCTVCGKGFLVRKGASGLYCSRECWYTVDRASKPCPVCKGSFRTGQQTCSRACAAELKRRNNPNRQANCSHCGSPIVGKKARVRFCSLSCSSKVKVHGPRSKVLPDGTRRPAATGYIRVKVAGKWVLEHRHVMAQTVGRPLLDWERVHHKNGDRADNSPQNLELWKIKSRKDPAGVRQSDYHCVGCNCG